MPQEAFVNKVINAVEPTMGYWDADLRCRFANDAYEVWFGKAPHEMLGLSIDTFLGPLYEPSLPHILGVLKGESQVFERDMMLRDGTVRHSLVSYYPDVADGTILGFSAHAVDNTRMKLLQFELDKTKSRADALARHDFLTGLPNRFLLVDRISELITQAVVSGELLGIVLMDIEGLKNINETHGHDAGDSVITEVARRLKSAIHPLETVIRMGGDEFLFLSPRVGSVLEVNLAVNRLLRAVQQPLGYRQAALVPSLSFGISVYPLDGTSVSELLASADRALQRWSSLRGPHAEQ